LFKDAAHRSAKVGWWSSGEIIMPGFARRAVVVFLLTALGLTSGPKTADAGVTREEVERAIREGVRFLKGQQRNDGSWTEVDEEARTGTTSLVTLALLTAGETPDSPQVAKALEFLRRFDAQTLNSVYAVSLQTMVFAAAKPKDDILRINRNVGWLEEAQLKVGDHAPWPGSWSYKNRSIRHGDNSNSQYALLALNAAAEVGVPIKAETWRLAQDYWKRHQLGDGSWAYTPDNAGPTGSMTCAGLSSLIITGLKRFQGREVLVGENKVDGCGEGTIDPKVQLSIRWLAQNFQVGSNVGMGPQWKYYYLYGLERAGRLSGLRFFGAHDWYREGAEELVHDQDKFVGSWRGTLYEREPLIATSFALLFLAKGRSPVLINKLRHGPGGDWNNDVDDIRNLVGLVSRDWNHLLTWQVVDPNTASLEDMLQAPIVYFNGHEMPVFTLEAKKRLHEYVEQGGFIFAEACCGRKEFDKGFRALMADLFPDPEYELKALSDDHAVWRSRWPLTPDIHPLWGIEHGCRTVVIYSPEDLSCYWNQIENRPDHPRVVRSQRVGQNVVDYATGREIPADKLSTPEVKNFKGEIAKRGALRIAKIKHGGEWNIAPLAIPNLMSTLHDKLKFDVVIGQKDLLPSDPNIVNYPLIYMHGRAAISFSDEDKVALRKHLDPGRGTLFADAACGSPAFDGAFRKFVADLFPNDPLVPIPRDDEIYSRKVYFDLSDCQYSKAAGGGKDFPQLEGVKIKGHWAIIYSKLDIGCALERHAGLDCKGYSYESAIRIASNIVIYATLP
jgi:hypothetical protein